MKSIDSMNADELVQELLASIEEMAERAATDANGQFDHQFYVAYKAGMQAAFSVALEALIKPAQG